MRSTKRLFLAFLVPATLFAAPQDLTFNSLAPCVVFDTRTEFGGTGPLVAETERSFHVVGSTSNFAAQGGTTGGCGVPGFSAGQPVVKAVFINYIAINPVGGGQLKVWSADQPEPSQGAMVNYQALTPPMNNSNAVITEVRQDSEGQDITLKAKASNVHARGVVLGYFTGDHKHSGEDIVDGTIDEARIDPDIARKTDIMPTVLDSDGTGSLLNADYLDGFSASEFATASHDHDSVYERKSVRTVVVRPVGSATANGTALDAALASITDNSGTNPYLLKIEPGIYDLGTGFLTMKPYVDIEGSGEGTTTIIGAGFGNTFNGTVNLADNSELRRLSVVNTGGNSYAIAVRVPSVPGARISHVGLKSSAASIIAYGLVTSSSLGVRVHSVESEASGVAASAFSVTESGNSAILENLLGSATASGPGTTGIGLSISGFLHVRNSRFVASGPAAAAGISVHSLSDASIEHVRAEARGTSSNIGVSFNGGSAVLHGVVAVAEGGNSCAGAQSANGGYGTISSSILKASGCTTNRGFFSFDAPSLVTTSIDNSKIIGSQATIFAGSNNTLLIGSSLLDGGPSNLGGGTETCVFVYDEARLGFASSCP